MVAILADVDLFGLCLSVIMGCVWLFEIFALLHFYFRSDAPGVPAWGFTSLIVYLAR